MIPVIMLRQGQSVESCIITKWHKRQGDTVAPGELLFSYETDKAAFDEEAKASGTVLAVLRQEGDDVPCLENVMLLGAPGEDVSAFLSAEGKAAEGERAPGPEAAKASGPSQPGKGAEFFGATPEAGALPAGKISPRARALAARTGAETRFIERSPAWAYNPESRLLKTVVETYERLNNTEPVVTALHAGLECGILAEKLPGLDIVSLGPDTFDLHTPDERLSISSAQRVWKFILALLEAL